MKSSIIIILVFSLLSSETFSENDLGGWGCDLKHNGVSIHNDTIHVYYGEVVEIWAYTWDIAGPAPSVAYSSWFLDDAVVPLEKFGGGYFSGRYELNQPGTWDFKIVGGGCNKRIVVVWEHEAVAEVLASRGNLNSELEKDTDPESTSAPISVEIVPNPSRNMIRIVSSSKISQLNILNQAGGIVYSSSPGTNEAVVHLHHLARGLYFAETISELDDRTIKRILLVD